MRTSLLITGLTLAVACGRSPSQPSQPGQTNNVAPGPTAILMAVSVSGPARVALGGTASYSATAVYSDGASKDVSAAASWSPPADRTWNPLYFTSPGVAVGASRGEVGIAASFNGKVGSLPVLVLESGTFKLSGTVSESGAGPLVATTVGVDVIAGTGRGLRATTGQQGRFVLYGVAGVVQLRVSADGFVPQIRELTVTADGTTDAFALVPIDAPLDISGTWTMTLMPSPGCPAGLPHIARGRTYQVHFVQQGTGLKVTIDSPTLQVFNAGENYGAINGPNVRFYFIGDTDYGDWSSADLIDHLSATETLQFDGMVQGIVTGSEVRATMDGDLMYYKLPTYLGPNWYCRAKDHIVTLRR